MPRFPFRTSDSHQEGMDGGRHEAGPSDRNRRGHGFDRGVPPASLNGYNSRGVPHASSNGYNGRDHFDRGPRGPLHGREMPGYPASGDAHGQFNSNMGASVNGNMDTFVNGNMPVRSFHDTGIFLNGNVGALSNGNTGSFHYGGMPGHTDGGVPGQLNGNMPAHLNGNVARPPYGSTSDRSIHNMGIAVDGITRDVLHDRVEAPLSGNPEYYPNGSMEFPPFYTTGGPIHYNTGGPVSYNMAGPYNHHVPDLWNQGGGHFMPGLSEGNMPHPAVSFNQPYRPDYPAISSPPLLGQMYRRAGPRPDQRIHWFGGGYSATYGPTDPVPLFTPEDAFMWQVEEIERRRIALRVSEAANRSNDGNGEDVYGPGLAHGDGGSNAGRRNQTYDNRDLVEDVGFARSYFGVHAGAHPANMYTSSTFQPTRTFTGYQPADTYAGVQSTESYAGFQSASAARYDQINTGENDGDNGLVARAPPPTPEYVPGMPRQTPYGLGELDGLLNAYNQAFDGIPEMEGYNRSSFQEASAYRLSPASESEQPRTVQTPVMNNAAMYTPAISPWEEQTPEDAARSLDASPESTTSSPKSDSDVLWYNLRRSYRRVARRPSPFPFQYLGSPELHSPNYVAFGAIDEENEEEEENETDEEEEFEEGDDRWTWR